MPLADPGFFMTNWRDGGRRYAFKMGLKHGAYCVGCCWMLMALLFVAGVMNLRVGSRRSAMLVLVEKGRAAFGRAIYLLLASEVADDRSRPGTRDPLLMERKVIFTIGHSTHPRSKSFLRALCRSTEIRSDSPMCDRYPSSAKRWPHFNQEEDLQRAVEDAPASSIDGSSRSAVVVIRKMQPQRIRRGRFPRFVHMPTMRMVTNSARASRN